MSWLQRIAQRFTDTQFWGKGFQGQNPDHVPQFDVYQSSDFPHVFLGGENEFDEAAEMAGQPICKVVDCRDLPEIAVGENDDGSFDWDYPQYLAVQQKFTAKVKNLVQIISSTQCPVFVHCALGANRSVSVLAAALAQLTGKPIEDLLAEMKQVRHFVSPQDPYYLMALQDSPATPEYKRQRFDELDQDFPLIQPSPITQMSASWLEKALTIQENRAIIGLDQKLQEQ